MTNFMVFDLETSISKGVHGPAAKDPNNDFYTVIVGNSAQNIQVIHKIKGYNRQFPAEAVEMMNKADVIIGHNLAFDLSYIYKTNTFQELMLRGGQIWDTQVAEYIMTGQRHSFSSLAELQHKYLGTRIKEDRISKLFKKSIGADLILNAAYNKRLCYRATFKIIIVGSELVNIFNMVERIKSTCTRLFKLYEKYCHDDGKTTIEIFIKQHAKAKQLGCLESIKVYNNYLLSLIIIQNTGINVDLQNCQTTLRDFKLKALEYLKGASNLVSELWDSRLGEFNINSPKDKSAILFGGTYTIKEKVQDGHYKNGNPKFKSVEKEIILEGFRVPTSISKESKIKGRYNTGADILEKILEKSKNDELKQYCELQKQAMLYGKMCSTYLEPFLNLSINGILYPNYNNTLTITSRLSSSKPNLQNVPSKGGMGEIIQKQLIAPEGWVCVSADYSQLEIYVLAYLSNDESLINDLLSGIDFHIKRLSYAEDMSYDDVYDLCKIQKLPEWELKRSYAKTVSYQKAYGASVRSLSRTTGLPEDVIQKIFDKEDEEYPDVAKFNNSVMEAVNNSKKLSYKYDLPTSKIGSGEGVNSRRFVADVELLPIIMPDGSIKYDKNEYRHIGYYKCKTGKIYSFEEIGREWKGRLKRGFSTTQTMNYQIQGTAADVQGSSSAAMVQLVIRHHDKVKLINEVHDSKWLLVKEEHLEKMIGIVKDVMENVPKNFKDYFKVEMPFNIPVEFKIGKNFGEMKPFSTSSIDLNSELRYTR